MKAIQAILLSLSIALLGACTDSTSTKTEMPAREISVLKTKSDSLAGMLFHPISANKEVYFREVDGKAVGNFFDSSREIHIAPGKHSVKVACSVYHGGIQANGVTVVELETKAGKTYVFTAKLSGGSSCSASYVEQ